jgi:hypothetical protein
VHLHCLNPGARVGRYQDNGKGWELWRNMRCIIIVELESPSVGRVLEDSSYV